MRMLPCLTLLALLALLALPACSTEDDAGDDEGEFTCVLDSESNSCTCDQQERTVSAGETVVELCDASPVGGAWECCYDLDTSGHTTSCYCAQWRCFQWDDGCACGFDTAAEPGEQQVDVCTGGVCVRSEGSCWCDDDPDAVLGGDETVPSCTPQTRACSSQMAPTCAGLDWKPPQPPGDGGCIQNGNACGPANQAVAACCNGYCGANGTCE